MTRLHLHKERHLVARIGWLRAAVLGANDGIVSTASLITGVAAAAADKSEILIAGTAGLVAGAMSMAAGEYVSVSSQSDTEKADMARERAELAADPRCRTSRTGANLHGSRAECSNRRAGCDPACSQGPAGHPFARRTGHFRNNIRAACASSIGLCCNLCGGCGLAVADKLSVAATYDWRSRFGRISGVSCAIGCGRRTIRRCGDAASNNSGYVLGRSSNGANSADRSPCRNGFVN